MAAVMFILPRMVRILMEGLMPLSEDAKKVPGKKCFPGKGSHDRMEQPLQQDLLMVISAALIMIPVTLCWQSSFRETGCCRW